MNTSTFRGRQTVTIQAPRAQVWEYIGAARKERAMPQLCVRRLAKVLFGL